MKEKVLFVLNNLEFGGVQSAIINIVEKLDCSMFELGFAVEGKTEGVFESALLKNGHKIYHLPVLKKQPFLYFRQFRKIIKKESYSVIHCNLNFLSFVPLVACPKSTNRVCHSHANYRASNVFSRIFRCFASFLINSHTDYRIACSSESGKWLYKKRDFLVIYNGIDTSRFRYNEETRSMMRKKFGISKHSVVVVNVANLTGIKRHDYLIESFYFFQKKIPDSSLFIIGEGNRKEVLISLINKLELNNKIKLVGKVRDVESYLSMSDIFAFTSLSEGFGICLEEAKSNGLPCVVTENLKPIYNGIDNIFFGDDNCPKLFAESLLQQANQNRCFDDVSMFDSKNIASLFEKIYLRKYCK